MKKFFLKISFIFISVSAMAQQEVNTEFATKMNLAFQPLEKIRVPYGLLKDQAFEFTELSAYNGVVTDTNYVTPVVIKQIYNTLLSARIHANASQFIQPSEYEQRWQANRTVGVITLSGLLYNYSQFKPNAITLGKLQVINNQFKDKYIGTTWQNPYDTRQTFAIAPSVRTYQGYNFSIKMPSNLWLTNVTQTVQSIQIDANDGLGYRNTTFEQNLAVSYTTSGLKHWYYKITMSNGQILYSHSNIIIEEGLVTTPHIDSSGGSSMLVNQPVAAMGTTGANTLGQKNIRATIPYYGVYASAKVVIDYASPDHKIRRPFIVVEGFDPGFYISPEQEFGVTSYKNFQDIIFRSQSNNLQNILAGDVLNNIPKQYDIIWVDFNNGTDYIQRNAYMLEAVIAWVNAEKAANGSNQSNVIMGQSMGGLVSRYALKDMEDKGIPTQTSLYISHDSPHQGANFPIGYQYLSRHALQQYVQSPLLLLGGEVIMPLFTDGVTPLSYLHLQDTPAARQMFINYVGIGYGINNTVHDTWQTELRLKGYPSMRKISISNGNHCAVPQNAPAGANLLSIDGNYSTGWLTDILLTAFPGSNSLIFKSLALITGKPGLLFGILPGCNKIVLDFKINSLPSAGINQIYKGKITYTKKLLWLININVTLTNKSFNSPSSSLPYDYYPGGAVETSMRNSASSDNGTFWQQALFKYNMSFTTEPSFCFIPATSALDIGLGNVPLDNNDNLKKYNKTVPLVSPKISPFDNFTTSYQNSFTLNNEDNFKSTNEHHIWLNLRNADWLAKEIDNVAYNNDSFDCTYMCSDIKITGQNLLCTNAIYSVTSVAPNYNWTITQGNNLVTMTGNGTRNISLIASPNVSGAVTISLTIGDNGIGFANKCGSTTITKTIWVGTPSKPTFVNYECPTSSYDAPCYITTPSNYNYLEFELTTPQSIVTSTFVDYEWETISGNFYFLPFWGSAGSQYSSTFQGPRAKVYITGANPVDNPLQFRCRAINSCGGGEWRTFIWNDGTFSPPPPPPATINYFAISPNPTEFNSHGGYLSVYLANSSNPTSGSTQKDINITNMYGGYIASTFFYGNSTTINIGNQPAGFYYVTISFGNYSESHTLIVN